jgi:DNA polymerase III subunit beta
MLFTIKRDDLFQAVASVQRATATRVIQPILANICLEALDKDTLKLSATDLDLFIETTIPAECLTLGKTTVAAKKLSELLSKLPKDQCVEFTVNQDTQTMKIVSGSVVFDIKTLPAEEFPEFPVFNDRPAIEIEGLAFLKAIQQTVFAAASHDSNNVLAGVYCSLANEGLEMAATDGSRLARRFDAVAGLKHLEQAVSAIIPARTLQELIKLFTPDTLGESCVQIGIHEGQIVFEAGAYRIVSRLLDGMYPQYNQLIPQNNQIVILSRRKEFMEALERTSVMANERTNIVKLSFSDNTMRLEAQTPDVGDSQDSMSVEYSGSPFQIAFNYRYVIDALRVIDADEIRMETSGSLAPTLFKPCEDNSYLCLVMPVQVK